MVDHEKGWVALKSIWALKQELPLSVSMTKCHYQRTEAVTKDGSRYSSVVDRQAFEFGWWIDSMLGSADLTRYHLSLIPSHLGSR